MLGHEGAGVVDAVGEAVTNVKPGDHVVLHTLAFCGACKWCVTGQPGVLPQEHRQREPAVHRRRRAGVELRGDVVLLRVHGGAGECSASKIDDEIDLSVACLIGCGVLTGIGSVWNRTDLGLGDTCVVFGVGGVGLNVIQAREGQGRERGSSRSTRVAEKEQAARDFGATDFILAGDGVDIGRAGAGVVPDARSRQRRSGPFGEGGVDYAFDCVGHPAILQPVPRDARLGR